MSVIGQAIDRVDGPAKVTGHARYSAEFAPERLAYAALVLSTVKSGTIQTIDTAAAEKAPGVLLVLTHQNAPRLAYLPAKERAAVEPVSGTALRVLQDASILFSGQPIGLVVAETQTQADYAASLVHAFYLQGSPAITKFDSTKAVPTSAEAAKKGRGPETKQGDPDAAFALAPVRVDASYVQPREHHNAMEPHVTIAEWRVDSLTLWDKTQWVNNCADEMARVFGIPKESVQVINPFIGGAFGSGLRTWPHVTLAALAARIVKRPVRLELTRRQLYYSTGFRPRSEQHVQLGANHDGELQAIIQEAVAQTSIFEEFADATLDVPSSTYASPNRRTKYSLVPLNTNTPTPMRGPGHSTGLIAQEIAMDELAHALNMDPIALRLRNYATEHPSKHLPWSSNGLRDCYRIGVESFDWKRRTPMPRSMRSGRNLVGLGMASAMNPAPRYVAEASVTLLLDGSALVRCATSDMGPGTYTSMTQVAADALNLPVSRVRFELGDTALPVAKEHGGSTTTVSVGPAVQAACAALIDSLKSLTPARNSMDFRKAPAILKRAGLESLTASGKAESSPDAKKYSTYSFGAVFAEVHVDPDFQTVRVHRLFGAYDAGRIINPKLAHSQCIGGMVGGVGMALLEEAEWDDRLGRVANANIAEYLIPVHADIHDLDAVFVPTEDFVLSPLGSKGLAELGLCGIAPAIANAVWHATGKRIRSLPITPDKLFMA